MPERLLSSQLISLPPEELPAPPPPSQSKNSFVDEKKLEKSSLAAAAAEVPLLPPLFDVPLYDEALKPFIGTPDPAPSPPPPPPFVRLSNDVLNPSNVGIEVDAVELGWCCCC